MRTFLLALLLPTFALAQVSYPMITATHPVAVQRGTTTTVTVSGTQDFRDAYQVLFEGKGLSAKVLPDKKAKPPLRAVQLEIATEARTVSGVRDFRVATRLGLSSVGQLVVSDYPVIVENPKNTTRETAQSVRIPCTIAGKIEVAEDVDYYRFRAEAGQTLTFEVYGARLQDRIHDLQKHIDPIIIIYDNEGRELAANDDFYFADPLLAFTFDKAGDYFVQVRDSKYDGDPRWVYALVIDDGPRPTHVFPPALKAGSTGTLEAVGAGVSAKFTAPSTPGIHDVILDTPGRKSAPVPLIVSELSQILEVEPNDLPHQATLLSLPCGVNGRIGTPGDVDHFRFVAKKGEVIRLEIQARRFGTLLRSSLDSHLEILNAKGAILASNDDTNGKDAALVFPVPADGTYTVRLRDLNSKGGPTFVYHLIAEKVRPDFMVKCDGDKAMLAPGASTAWFVQLTRTGGFTGPVKIEATGLPAGVTVNPLTIAPGQSQGLLVLTADLDAPIAASEIQLKATGQPGTRPVVPLQEIYFPGGGRGTIDVATFAVAVTEPGDLRMVKVTPGEIVLKPGQEVRLEVTLERAPGFDKSVTLDVLLRHLGRVFGNTLPPGVTVVEAKSKTLLGKANTGHIVLRCAPDAAEVDQVPISVLAHVSVNFVVKMTYSSPVIPLSIRK
jgi:hypothetical protein